MNQTNLGNLAIARGYHNGSANTQAPKQNWRTVMINGVPHWQPPPWHPDRRPQRNYIHHPELFTTPPE
ncbi:MAG TPA: hypothetical protein VFU36_12865 [Jatrophihabitans sp.]|nr:hypothetical protein [Jatrophihabitans sp.]